MATKKNPSKWWSGAFVLLGTLIYLIVIFTWYGGHAAAGPWLSAAQFLAPFVAALAIVLTISMLLMSLGMLAGKPITLSSMWQYLMADAVFMLILSAGGSWFYAVVIAFILTYIGTASAYM